MAFNITYMKQIGWSSLITSVTINGQRLLLPRLIQFIFLLLLIFSARQLAQLTWRLQAELSLSTIKSWQPNRVSAQNSMALPKFDLSEISQLALFGKIHVKKQQPVAALTNAPRTGLNAQLNGVLASSNPEKSIAIIAISGQQRSYGINEMIEGTQATVQYIFADRVIISRDGRSETLMLDGEEYGKSLPRDEPPVQPNPSFGSYRRAIIENPNKITDLLSIHPAQNEGTIAGYYLNPGKEADLFSQAGLQPNDLATTINGMDLRDSAQAMQAIQLLTTASAITLTVERDGVPLDLFIELSE